MSPAARAMDLLSLLPTDKCISPKLAMEASTLGRDMNNSEWSTYLRTFIHVDSSQIGMDNEEFENSTFQRVYQYLRRHDSDPNLLDQFKYEGRIEGNITDCLQLFLK